MKQLKLFFDESEIENICNKWKRIIQAAALSGVSVNRICELTKLPKYIINEWLEDMRG
jgi:hypothetical protein